MFLDASVASQLDARLETNLEGVTISSGIDLVAGGKLVLTDQLQLGGNLILEGDLLQLDAANVRGSGNLVINGGSLDTSVRLSNNSDALIAVQTYFNNNALVSSSTTLTFAELVFVDAAVDVMFEGDVYLQDASLIIDGGVEVAPTGSLTLDNSAVDGPGTLNQNSRLICMNATCLVTVTTFYLDGELVVPLSTELEISSTTMNFSSSTVFTSGTLRITGVSATLTWPVARVTAAAVLILDSDSLDVLFQGSMVLSNLVVSKAANIVPLPDKRGSIDFHYALISADLVTAGNNRLRPGCNVTLEDGVFWNTTGYQLEVIGLINLGAYSHINNFINVQGSLVIQGDFVKADYISLQGGQLAVLPSVEFYNEDTLIIYIDSSLSGVITANNSFSVDKNITVTLDASGQLTLAGRSVFVNDVLFAGDGLLILDGAEVECEQGGNVVIESDLQIASDTVILSGQDTFFNVRSSLAEISSNAALTLDDSFTGELYFSGPVVFEAMSQLYTGGNTSLVVFYRNYVQFKDVELSGTNLAFFGANVQISTAANISNARVSITDTTFLPETAAGGQLDLSGSVLLRSDVTFDRNLEISLYDVVVDQEVNLRLISSATGLTILNSLSLWSASPSLASLKVAGNGTFTVEGHIELQASSSLTLEVPLVLASDAVVSVDSGDMFIEGGLTCVTSSKIEVTGSLYIRNEAGDVALCLPSGTGAFHLQNYLAALPIQQDLVIGSLNLKNSAAILSADNTIFGNVEADSAYFIVSGSNGSGNQKAAINGDLMLSQATLLLDLIDLELNSLTMDANSFLNVTISADEAPAVRCDSAQLAGAFLLNLGAQSSSNGSFTVVHAANPILGSFSSAQVLNQPSINLSIDYQPLQVIISLSPAATTATTSTAASSTTVSSTSGQMTLTSSTSAQTTRASSTNVATGTGTNSSTTAAASTSVSLLLIFAFAVLSLYIH